MKRAALTYLSIYDKKPLVLTYVEKSGHNKIMPRQYKKKRILRGEVTAVALSRNVGGEDPLLSPDVA